MSRLPTPEDRRMMHQRGFGDGAKGNAQKFPADEDYMEAWTAGMNAARGYMVVASKDHGLPPPQVTREQLFEATAPIYAELATEPDDARASELKRQKRVIQEKEAALLPPLSGGYLACITPGCGDEDLMDLDQTTGLCGMCTRQKAREATP